MFVHRYLAISPFILIALCRPIDGENAIFGGAGEGVELLCPAIEGSFEGEASVFWRRLSGNGSQVVASLRVRGWERDGGPWALLRDGPHTLLILNLTSSDSGNYSCADSDGRRETKSLRVDEWGCSDDLDRRNVSAKNLGTLHGPGLPPLCHSPGETASFTCGLNSSHPISWDHLGGDGTSRRSVDNVTLSQGVGIYLQDLPPSLIIHTLHSRDSGIYECQVNSTFSKVHLTVRATGHLWSFTRIWIPITAATICAFLYLAVLAIGVAIRNRKEDSNHRSRMASLLSSFFRRSKYTGTMAVSLTRVIEIPPHQNASLRGSSDSTWYENVRPAGTSGQQEAMEVEGVTGADDAISYENLDQDNSDAEVWSEGSEDYMEPIPEQAAPMTTKIQVHGEAVDYPEEFDETSLDEDESRCPSEPQVYVPMSNRMDQKMDHSSASSDDYEKMDSSGNSDTIEAETELSREELLRMERCRLLFQRKFKTNLTNRTTMADVVLALRDPS